MYKITSSNSSLINLAKHWGTPSRMQSILSPCSNQYHIIIISLSNLHNIKSNLHHHHMTLSSNLQITDEQISNGTSIPKSFRVKSECKWRKYFSIVHWETEYELVLSRTIEGFLCRCVFIQLGEFPRSHFYVSLFAFLFNLHHRKIGKYLIQHVELFRNSFIQTTLLSQKM